MILNKLNKFSADLLEKRLGSEGFVCRNNLNWFKAVPDVLLCVQIRKNRGLAFDMTFGIIPFVCIKSLELNPGRFQPDAIYAREYRSELIRYYNELNGMQLEDRPRFLFSIDSTEKRLKDERQYDVLLRYWGDVFDKIAAPFLFSVRDLESAVDAIGDFYKYRGRFDSEKRALVFERAYTPDDMAAFMKLGKTQEAMKYWDGFIRAQVHSEQDMLELERKAEQARSEGKYTSVSLWYWLMKNDDKEGMEIVVSELEKHAYSWLAKNKIVI